MDHKEENCNPYQLSNDYEYVFLSYHGVIGEHVFSKNTVDNELNFICLE